MENQEPKQYVTKPLKLNSVPKSENESVNVLVRGADKTVKFITREELTPPQVNADWYSNWGPSQIFNKPDIDALASTVYVDQQDSNLQNQIYEKQDTLVSGATIKTINGESIIGSGNIEISIEEQPTPTLQAVLDKNNTATTSIIIEESAGSKTTIGPFGIGFKKPDNYVGNLVSSALTSFRTWFLPNRDGTLAMSVNGITADSSGNIQIPAAEPQTLQQLLETGQEADNRSIFLSSSDGKNASLQYNGKVEAGDGLSKYASINYDGKLQLIDGDNNSNYLYDRIVMTKNEDLHTFSFPEVNGNTFLVTSINGQFADSNGNVTVSASTAPTPTLQQVMNAGSAASINGEAGILSNSDNGYSRFYVSGELVELNNVDTALKKALSLNLKDGELKITRQNTDTGKYTMINVAADPIASTEISFPNKTAAGNYVLATTSDFKTVNGQSIIGTGDISVDDSNVLHKTGNESKEGDLYINGNLGVSQYLGITGNIEITDLDTFPRPPETTIILDKNGDLTAKNFIGRSIVSDTGQFYSNVKIGTSASSENKLEVTGTISTNGIKIAAANAESSDTIFANTPVGSQRTIAGNTIEIAGAMGDYFLETFRYNAANYGMQRITFTSTAATGRFFIRTLTAGAWSAWIEK